MNYVEFISIYIKTLKSMFSYIKHGKLFKSSPVIYVPFLKFPWFDNSYQQDNG